MHDVSHFPVFVSPNSIPRAKIKNPATAEIINDKPYAININHHGKENF